MNLKSRLLVSIVILLAVAAWFLFLQQRSQTAELERRLELAERERLAAHRSLEKTEADLAEGAHQNQALRARLEQSDGKQRQLQELLDARRGLHEKAAQSKTAARPLELKESAAYLRSSRDRPDTLDEQRLLVSLQYYLDHVEFLSLDDLSKTP